MRLPDEVTIYTPNNERSIKTKAAVKYSTWDERVDIPGGQTIQSLDEISMLIPAGVVEEDEIASVEWRGKLYRTRGLVKVFRRRGRDHHFQVRLTERD